MVIPTLDFSMRNEYIKNYSCFGYGDHEVLPKDPPFGQLTTCRHLPSESILVDSLRLVAVSHVRN